MTGPPKLSQAAWDKHKAYLHDLYIIREKTLSQVIQQAENERGFRPSKAQYIRQFKKWKFDKNLRSDQWRKISKAVDNRKSYGKESEIIIKNGRVSDRRLRKEMSRYRPHEHDDCSDLTLDDMDGIIIGTPQGEAVQAINYLQIPWFRFQTLIEPYFEKMLPRDFGLTLFNPSVSLASDMMQIEPPTEALRLLAACTSTSTDANAIFGTLYNDLNDITIQMHDHECGEDLMQRRGPSKLEQMSLFIRYFVYLSSNNLLDTERIDKLVKWIVESKTHWVLDLLLDLRTHSTEIFGSNIFVSAARLGSIDVVRSLIARGIDLDAPAGPDLRHTALEEAVLCQHPRVVELLLNEGADPKTQIMGENWLLDAALRGSHRLEILKMLFKKGADVNAIDHYSIFENQLLANAVDIGDLELIRFLLEAGADIDAFDTYWGTALQVAVASQNVETVQILIDAGADIEATAGYLKHDESYDLLRTPLQQASLAGNEEIVQILVNEGADVNAFQWEGYDTLVPWQEYRRHQWESYDKFEDTRSYRIIMMTPLQAAVFRRDLVIVQILLDAAAHVDAKGYGDTPLQMAAALDQAELVQILRRHGADVNAPAADDGGMTALQAAARANNYELVQALLVSGSKINAAASPSGGRTALQAAAESGNVDLAKFLIEVGADVNADASPKSGRTSLQAAVEHGHMEMFLMLLNEGADVNAPSSPQGGMTTIVGAVLSGRADLVRWCLFRGSDPIISAGGTTALGAAVLRGSDDLVALLVEAGADVNARCELYCPTFTAHKYALWTALHVAARTGRIEIASLLLQAGAEINMPLPHPGSPTVLQSAIDGNSVTMVQFLLSKGADPNAYGAVSRTPRRQFFIFSNLVHMEILNALAVAGGDFNRIFEEYELSFAKEVLQKSLESGALLHWTPEQKGYLLQFVIGRGYTDLVQEMLDGGAYFNTPAARYFGRTALQQATVGGYTDVVTLLLSYGADVNAPAGHQGGITALQGAALNGNLKIVLTLLQAGAEINAPPAVKNGRTALQAAAEHGRLDIVFLLLANDHDMEGMEPRCEDAADIAESEGHKVIARILREHKAG